MNKIHIYNGKNIYLDCDKVLKTKKSFMHFSRMAKSSIKSVLMQRNAVCCNKHKKLKEANNFIEGKWCLKLTNGYKNSFS
jgi:hypothetical protein